MPKIEANGINIYYELHGPENADVIVLSNGILMSTASWVYQTPVLSRHYRVLLYDARGQWQSDHPEGPYSMELHADDLAALMDALGIEKAHIGGTSYGAEISMVFALRHPERTRSLIVTSAVSHVDPLLRGLTDMWSLAGKAGDPELLYRVVYPLTFSEDWIAAHDDALAQARQRYETLDMRAFCTLVDCFAEMDVTAELHDIEAPALVVAGEDDMLKRRIYSEIIASEIPNVEFVIIPHAGHAAMWEQAGVFNTLILGFVAKHAGR